MVFIWQIGFYMADILIADDDRAIRMVLTRAFTDHGYQVRATGSAVTLWNWVADGLGRIVISDVIMPDGDGLDLLPRILAQRPDLKIFVMSAYTNLGTAVKATHRGAFDYLPKPFDLNEMVSRVERALQGGPAADSLFSEQEVSPPSPLPEKQDEHTPNKHVSAANISNGRIPDEFGMIGRSAVMQESFRRIARLSATDLTVLIIGESGTGKEVAARALHHLSDRQNGPFVAVNMAAIPRELIESELFGHEKGAFTGATHRQIGHFEQADGGSLFLDEIGDMPLEAQTRLLRVLQDRRFNRIGGRASIATNARILAATHRDLGQLVAEGSFREDLYYRLAVAPVSIPPLRARRADIPELAVHFLRIDEEDGDGRSISKSLSKGALERLQAHDWPGNVRELMNLMQRLNALCPDAEIDVAQIEDELMILPTAPLQQAAADSSAPSPHRHGTPTTGANNGLDSQLTQAVERILPDYFLSLPEDSLPSPQLYGHVIRIIEEALFSAALKACNGNRTQCAKLLGINRNTLRTRLNAIRDA